MSLSTLKQTKSRAGRGGSTRRLHHKPVGATRETAPRRKSRFERLAFDGDEIGSTGGEAVVELRGWSPQRPKTTGANDNAPMAQELRLAA